jgi:hypothetical protein
LKAASGKHAKTLDPGLRRVDDFQRISIKNVVLAEATGSAVGAFHRDGNSPSSATMDFSPRCGDDSACGRLSNVIPAQAGIQRL